MRFQRVSFNKDFTAFFNFDLITKIRVTLRVQIDGVIIRYDVLYINHLIQH